MTGGLLIESVAGPGQVCEGRCRRELTPGEVVFGDVVRVFGGDPYGMDATRSDSDLSTGTVSENFRCQACFIAEVQT